MQAWQFNTAEAGLELTEVEAPVPGPGEVLIDVAAAGMCHSDVHIVNGHGDDWLRKRPITLGHEVAGTVSGLGAGVAGLSVGDRVAVALPAHPIEQADFTNGIGLGFDGGYAKQAVAPRDIVVAIPDGVPFTHAAVATDSIATAYHAVVAEAGVEAGATVAVIGLGGLGLSAVAVAKSLGATVYGVDINTAVFDLARKQGATECFANIGEVPTPIDAVLDFAGMGTTTAEAIAAVKLGGRVVVVGLGAPEANIPTQLLVTKNVQLRGSLGASIPDLEAVLELLATGQIVPAIEEVPFAEVPAVLARIEAGKVQGRLVTCP